MAEDQPGSEERGSGYGQKLAEMAKKNFSEAFYALDDPLEAAVFAVLVEMLKEMDKAYCKNDENEIEATSLLQS